MHPEFKDASNFIYIYPSEFDIEYCFGEGQNQKIHRISSCVLTEMNVNYSPNGVFSTFLYESYQFPYVSELVRVYECLCVPVIVYERIAPVDWNAVRGLGVYELLGRVAWVLAVLHCDLS